MKRLNFRQALLSTVAMIFAMVSAAGADVIGPGSTTTNLNPQTNADLPTGALLASITGTFTGALTGSPSGTYTAEVVTNASGFLDFVYRFNNTGSKDLVDSVTMSNFAGFMTDVFTDPNNLLGDGNDPDSASSTGTGPNVIKFFFTPDNDGDDDDVGPGQSSDTLVIATNASNFQPGIFTFQNGDTASVAAFQPTATPEPGSMLLFGTGLSAVAAALRRRTKKTVTRISK